MAFLNILVRSVTQFVDMFLVAQESRSLSLTFTKRSLKLNVSVTDLFTSFGYSGINRTNGVISSRIIEKWAILTLNQYRPPYMCTANILKKGSVHL